MWMNGRDLAPHPEDIVKSTKKLYVVNLCYMLLSVIIST